MDLAPSAYDMVIGSLPPPQWDPQHALADGEKLSKLQVSSAMKETWRSAAQSSPLGRPLSPRAQGKSPQRPPHESFVLLQDSVVRNIPSPTRGKTAPSSKGSSSAATSDAQLSSDHPAPLSHHLRSSQRLLNLLSSRTDIDHPLCSECTHILLHTLNRQLEETKRERDGYIAFEREVRKEREREREQMTTEAAQERIEQLKQDERLAIGRLWDAERDREQLTAELEALELEEKALEEEEEEYVIAGRHRLSRLTSYLDFGAVTMPSSLKLPNKAPSWQHFVLHTLRT